MDSDTLVHANITPFLLPFLQQRAAQVYLVADHAMQDAAFCAEWTAVAGTNAGEQRWRLTGC